LRIEISDDRFNASDCSDIAQAGKQISSDCTETVQLLSFQHPVIEAKSGAFPNRRGAEIDGIRNGIRKDISEKSWPRRGQKTHAAFDFATAIVGANNIDRSLVIVLVAFFSLGNLNIPPKPVVKNAGAQLKHPVDQMRMFVEVILLNYDNHFIYPDRFRYA
jgi:hypothetical protein